MAGSESSQPRLAFVDHATHLEVRLAASPGIPGVKGQLEELL
jgi:hypothetical protein